MSTAHRREWRHLAYSYTDWTTSKWVPECVRYMAGGPVSSPYFSQHLPLKPWFVQLYTGTLNTYAPAKISSVVAHVVRSRILVDLIFRCSLPSSILSQTSCRTTACSFSDPVQMNTRHRKKHAPSPRTCRTSFVGAVVGILTNFLPWDHDDETYVRLSWWHMSSPPLLVVWMGWPQLSLVDGHHHHQ